MLPSIMIIYRLTQVRVGHLAEGPSTPKAEVITRKFWIVVSMFNCTVCFIPVFVCDKAIVVSMGAKTIDKLIGMP